MEKKVERRVRKDIAAVLAAMNIRLPGPVIDGLGQLKEQGILTEEEFAARKAAIPG